MSTPDPVPGVVPAMPWYQSKVITALVTIVVSQLVGLAARKFAIDITTFGLSVPDIVTFAMNTLAGVAVAYGWVGRVATAPVTLKKSTADAINAAAPIVQPPTEGTS